MKVKKLLIIAGVIILIGITGFCYFIGISVFNGSTQLVNNEDTSIENGKSYLEMVDFDLEEFKSEYTIEAIKIESTLDDHIIPADYITVNGNKNADTVIMVHGLGGNRVTVYPVAKMFLQNGYNVIAYDQRSSGENTAQYTTFGYLESHDVKDYVVYLKDNIDEDKKVGIWGTSFGGATVGIYLGSEEANENVDFVVLDCPVSDMSYMVYTEMEEMNTGLPLNFLMSMGDIATKMKLGFSYEDANVSNHISKTKVPVLVINSKADQLTPYFMGEDIYNSITHSNKEIFTVEDSQHADIFFDYPDEYENSIIKFIEQLP